MTTPRPRPLCRYRRLQGLLGRPRPAPGHGLSASPTTRPASPPCSPTSGPPARPPSSWRPPAAARSPCVAALAAAGLPRRRGQPPPGPPLRRGRRPPGQDRPRSTPPSWPTSPRRSAPSRGRSPAPTARALGDLLARRRQLLQMRQRAAPPADRHRGPSCKNIQAAHRLPRPARSASSRPTLRRPSRPARPGGKDELLAVGPGRRTAGVPDPAGGAARAGHPRPATGRRCAGWPRSTATAAAAAARATSAAAGPTSVRPCTWRRWWPCATTPLCGGSIRGCSTAARPKRWP